MRTTTHGKDSLRDVVFEFHDNWDSASGSAEFDNDEYIEWEKFEDRTSEEHPEWLRLAWSSSKDLRYLVRCLREQFGGEDSDRLGMVTTSTGEAIVLPAADVVDWAMSCRGRVVFFRLDYEDFAVTWAPQIRGSDTPATGVSEVTYCSVVHLIDGARQLMSRTATGTISTLGTRILSNVVFVGA